MTARALVPVLLVLALLPAVIAAGPDPLPPAPDPPPTSSPTAPAPRGTPDPLPPAPDPTPARPSQPARSATPTTPTRRAAPRPPTSALTVPSATQPSASAKPFVPGRFTPRVPAIRTPRTPTPPPVLPDLRVGTRIPPAFPNPTGSGWPTPVIVLGTIVGLMLAGLGIARLALRTTATARARATKPAFVFPPNTGPPYVTAHPPSVLGADPARPVRQQSPPTRRGATTP